MITCFMFGSYTTESLKTISADRTKEALIQLEELGGKVKSMYALLGDQDLIFIVDFPDVNTAIKASVALTKLIGVPFSTSPAVTVEEFDAMMEEL
ncbi:GYD domain-containing protein [Candidatus Neomarinimicrobiota bacterium]